MVSLTVKREYDIYDEALQIFNLIDRCKWCLRSYGVSSEAIKQISDFIVEIVLKEDEVAQLIPRFIVEIAFKEGGGREKERLNQWIDYLNDKLSGKYKK